MKKKHVVYISIFAIQIIATFVVSAITGVSTGNTWLGTVFVNMIWATIALIIIKEIQKKDWILQVFAYLFVFIVTLAAVIITIITIAEA